MADDSSKKDVIDLREIYYQIKGRKNLFLKVWVITFILSCIWILPQPRSYVSTTSMAPEMMDMSQLGSLSSLASSFGFNVGGNPSSDAFYPELYPDVISTNEFIVKLLNVQVETIERDDEPSIKCDYFTHITRDLKKNWLTFPIRIVIKWIKSLFTQKKKPVTGLNGINPSCLSREEEALIELVRSNVICDVDKRTNVITISVWDQDPLTASIMADSIRSMLQNFIIEYRTNKACIDLDYYKALTDSARSEYQNVADAYSRFCDQHQNVILQRYMSERDILENDMSAKLTTYNAMNAQYETAKAKVQERTPAFTILSKPSVANKPMKPKRMLFVIAMLFLSTCGTIAYIFKEEIARQLSEIK